MRLTGMRQAPVQKTGVGVVSDLACRQCLEPPQEGLFEPGASVLGRVQLDHDHRDSRNHLRGLTPLSLCDWPGHPCCVVFLGGCNLRCPTCHNGGMAWDMEAQPLVPQASLRAFLAKRKRWLSGITVTGGEPTTVPGVGAILHELSASGLPIKFDTNGMLPEASR